MPSLETIAAQDAINSLLMHHDIKMSAVFVPQSMSRNSTEKERTINWRVTLASARGAFAFDYQQGIGHVPNYRTPRTLYEESAQGKPWEDGYYNPRPGTSHYGRKKLPPPTAADILYCVVLDASCIGQSFEDWAADMGADSDSRKAERTYHDCVRQTESAMRVLGREVTAEATKILENY